MFWIVNYIIGIAVTAEGVFMRGMKPYMNILLIWLGGINIGLAIMGMLEYIR